MLQGECIILPNRNQIYISSVIYYDSFFSQAIFLKLACVLIFEIFLHQFGIYFDILYADFRVETFTNKK